MFSSGQISFYAFLKGLVCIFVCFYVSFFQYRAKRLAGKNVSKITYFVSSET